MRDHASAGNMTGSLLVAHPHLRDPHFRRTILFLSHHNAEDGAIGLVLNRPLSKTMNEVAPEASAEDAALLRVPVFYGGPVGENEVMLASMQWHDSPGAVSFRGFGNVNEEPVIPPEYRPWLRAFRGYSGWSRGQLEAEIAEKSWLVFPPSRRLIEMPHPDRAWREIMQHLGPIYRLLAEMPDDPSLN
ncbi:MAG TPA: YqgE/AlgH family protein [Chthoniobacterales bacterium]|nr:YqgE/AlgH family protein [Chthoniobacterales bacterium]